ncbi:MAG TPA: hypothetical protein VKT82_09765 [Ktedonobacterales bacterium]|nr:hypothetical protein [Ktedonobacterales bacterium]
MLYLPLERLLAIATGQAMPGVVGASINAAPHALSVVSPASPVDARLAARMIANGLYMALRDEIWRSHPLGNCGRAGETNDLRLILWMDSDNQPGIAAVWDLTLEAPSKVITTGTVLPRPALVIGRNLRSGEYFVLRCVPGAWVERLQAVSFGVQRSAS